MARLDESRKLAAEKTQIGVPRAIVRPVSRITFELSDKLAFESAIDLCLKWMQPRSNTKLPPEAWTGSSFDVSDKLGANPCRAARLDTAGGSTWAGRLDYPENDTSIRRTWVTELFAEKRSGRLTRFGAQLTTVTMGDAPLYEITRPTVVRHILKELSAEADGFSITESPWKIRSDEVGDLVDLIYSPARRLPIVAISSDTDDRAAVSADEVSHHLGGSAHIVHLPPDSAWELTGTIGKRMSVFNGAARIYIPGLQEDNEDPFDHPLWMVKSPTTDASVLRSIAARVLPYAFFQSQGSEEFLRVGTIREQIERATQLTATPTTELLRLRQIIDLRDAEFFKIKEERDTWEGLANDEQYRRIQAENDLQHLKNETEQLKDEVNHLSAKSEALKLHLQDREITESQPVPARRLTSYDDLEDWSDVVLGKNIYIHQAALKDCRKNGHESTLERLEKALIVIRDFVVPARLDPTLENRDRAREELTKIGMLDSACFVDRDEAKRTPGYSVRYQGITRILYDHIKYGNGYDNANQIRIYYFWDQNDEIFVIGKMPSHLPNNLTT